MHKFCYCVIMRGVPGSGKSTFADELFMTFAGWRHVSDLFNGGKGWGMTGHDPEKGVWAVSWAKPDEPRVALHSTDNYFLVDGEYRFEGSKLGRYHAQNFEAFKSSLARKIPLVILDNTNTRRWEYEKYLTAAQEAGYIVSVVSMPHPDPEVAAERNSHGVPVDVIRRMIDRWED